MIPYTIRKSELSLEGYFSRPAFHLFRPNAALHETVAKHLSDHLVLRGGDITIDANTSPLSNANVTYDLRPFNGAARISIDRVQLAFYSPHTLDTNIIESISAALFNAVNGELPQSTYERIILQMAFHAELEGTSPAVHTAKYVSTISDDLSAPIGHSVTHYFGQTGSRLHSSVTLDMSGEYTDCIFVRLSVAYDGSMISVSDLRQPILQHLTQLLSLVGLNLVQ